MDGHSDGTVIAMKNGTALHDDTLILFNILQVKFVVMLRYWSSVSNSKIKVAIVYVKKRQFW